MSEKLIKRIIRYPFKVLLAILLIPWFPLVWLLSDDVYINEFWDIKSLLSF